MTLQTPNNIDVLIHFHSNTARHPREDAPAVVEAIFMLVQEGAIEQNPWKGDGFYQTTNKGKAWVEALCRVEAPRAAWVDTSGAVLGLNP